MEDTVEYFSTTCELAAQFLKTIGTEPKGHSVYGKYMVSKLSLSKGTEEYIPSNDYKTTPLKTAATIDLFLHGGKQHMPKEKPQSKGWLG